MILKSCCHHLTFQNRDWNLKTVKCCPRECVMHKCFNDMIIKINYFAEFEKGVK